MRVAPSAPLGALDISVGHIHASRETHLAIYHQNLAVVAVVDFATEKKGRPTLRKQ